jgi:phosphate transport system permease protein
MALAVPPCLLCAIYLAEYRPRRLRDAIKLLIDLLAGIPSVVYGLWGVLMVVPVIRDVITPWAGKHLLLCRDGTSRSSPALAFGCRCC